MTKGDLEFLKQWFSKYAKSFYSSNEEDQRNIILKVEHTEQVCKNILRIAGSLSLRDNQIRIAEAIALFHDLGRFPQYARYRTFRDADSMNHGLLGAQTLNNENVLKNLMIDERAIILNAVKFHNAFRIPTVLNSDAVFYLKLIRDADKLDIYRVFIEYYESPAHERASATAFGVPDTQECSREMLSSILQGKIASYSFIKTENDFRLMKLSWVYDMHFDESVRLLQERNCINNLVGKLPDTEEVKAVVAHLKGYVEKRLNKQ